MPLNVLAAEVLQISSPTVFRIGDRNRTYTVKLSCVEVEPSSNELAMKWLKSRLKKKTRVNFNQIQR